MPLLILLRGLPGAGKTTLAKALCENGKWPVFSVDDYFIHPETGEYRFEFDKNHLAYKDCTFKTEEAMKKGVDKIFIDNTFTQEWEIEPYTVLAKTFGYQMHVMTVENRHGGNNSHGVSHEQMEKMASKYRVKLF